MGAVITIIIITLIANNTNFSAAQNNFNNEKTKREITAPRTGKRSIIDDEKEKLRIDFKLLACG
jgi:hypothetical protein